MDVTPKCRLTGKLGEECPTRDCIIDVKPGLRVSVAIGFYIHGDSNNVVPILSRASQHSLLLDAAAKLAPK